MKFAVKTWSKGRARAGVVQLVVRSSCSYPTEEIEIEIETPALLLSTRKGLPFFISPDLLPSLPSPDSHILQFSPLHFLEGLTPTTMSNMGGLHQMLGLYEYGFAAVPRDSIVCLPECDATNKTGASFETPCGRRLMKPLEYMELISSMKPNFWATLADEVPAWVSEKRNKTSVDRTIRWLDDCIALSSVELFLEPLLEALVWKNADVVLRKLQSEMYQVTGLGGLGLERAWMSVLLSLMLLQIIYHNKSHGRFVALDFQRRSCRALLQELIFLTPRIFTILQLEALHLPFHWTELRVMYLICS